MNKKAEAGEVDIEFREKVNSGKEWGIHGVCCIMTQVIDKVEDLVLRWYGHRKRV